MHNITAIIIAGGSNSRFFPLEGELNKGGFSLLGQPLITKTLENLKQNGVNKVICVVSPQNSDQKGLSKSITESNPGLEITFVTQERPTGMGDAVLLAASHLQTNQFLLLSPYHTTAGDVMRGLLATNQPSAVCTITTEVPWRYGVISIQDNLATSITEKPSKGTEPSNQRVQSIYLLDQKFIEMLEKTPKEQYSLETALNSYMKSHPVGIFPLDHELPSLKYAWQLFDFLPDLFSQASTKISKDAKIAKTAELDDTNGPIIIESGAQISHAAHIVGPCYIGKNSFIGDFSLVRGSNINENCTLGAYTEVVRSIILENSSVHQSYLADSIIGSNNKIGAGLITANKRHDRAQVKTLVKNKITRTFRNNLGVATGRNVKLGIRVSTMPGVLIGKNQVVMPSTTIYKNLNHKEIEE